VVVPSQAFPGGTRQEHDLTEANCNAWRSAKGHGGVVWKVQEVCGVLLAVLGHIPITPRLSGRIQHKPMVDVANKLITSAGVTKLQKMLKGGSQQLQGV
jgi:hypothetical protein